jgi:hypothetical protein
MNNTVLYQWPWFSLFIGITYVVFMPILFRIKSAWKDKLLLWLPLPLYFIHQFEEHGIDFLGRHYEFQSFFCGSLGFENDLAHCPGTPLFIFAVNIGMLWVAGILGGLFGSRKPLLVSGFVGIIFINAVTHISNGIVHLHYNPGLVTSFLIFLPASVGYYRYFRKKYNYSGKDVAASVFIGALIHIILMVSLKISAAFSFSEELLVAANVLNGFTPLLVASIYQQKG